MATTEFIAAIELGSSKITGVAGRKNSDGSMQILAYAQEDSSTFIRKGVIFNLDKTAQSLTSIINRLEGELNNSIAKVYVGIGGQSLRTIRNVESCDVPQEDNGCVTQELIDSLCDANRETPLINFASIPMTILDVAPQEYKIDKNAQLNPVGALGTHIDGNFLNIVARTSLLTNLELCFKRARITIADWFISPLVLADVVLNENERRSGCALIDFGADTTTLSVYKNNLLRFLTVLPLGGKNITRDLTTLQIEEEEAERLKLEYGCALLEDEEEDKEAETCQLEDGRKVTLNEINNIVEARTEEIVANVWNLLRDSGYEDKLLAGLVITGGAANLPQLTNVLQKKTKISKIRMAKSVHSTVYADLSEDILRKDGTQNTLMGLLFAGTENCCLQETPPEENLVAETVAPEKPGHEEEIPEPTPHHPTENSTKPNNKPRKGPDKPKKPGLFDKLGQFSRNLFDDDTSDTF